MNNIEVFQDTLSRIRNDPKLAELTRGAVSGTRVYPEGFCSPRVPLYDHSRVSFEESLTLIPALRFADAGRKTAVLNFANPVRPDGVLEGAGA